jgi:hypothetical protein
MADEMYWKRVYTTLHEVYCEMLGQTVNDVFVVVMINISSHELKFGLH